MIGVKGMYLTIKQLGALGLILGLGACASTSKTVKSTQYTVGVKPVLTDEVKQTTCPSENKTWKDKPWKQVIHMMNACVKKKKWRQVEKMANELAKKENLAPWGSYYLSLVAERKEKYSRAMWMVDSGLKKSPGLALLLYQKGRLHWKQGEHDLAVESIESALDREPDLNQARLFLGQIELRDQQFSKAHKLFSEVLAKDPNNRAANLGMAECLIAKQNWQGAVESWNKVISKSPKKMEYRLRRAWVLETKLVDASKALAAYRKIRYLKSKNRLIGKLPVDIDAKIESLTVQVAALKAKALSQREPAVKKKVSK